MAIRMLSITMCFKRPLLGAPPDPSRGELGIETSARAVALTKKTFVTLRTFFVRLDLLQPTLDARKAGLILPDEPGGSNCIRLLHFMHIGNESLRRLRKPST
ncbi:hypothetical protein XU18_4297 [Perkinsela sp. CCAP 1560/4]|nr:hypothetical protein XU18_4297 [Perkinsela sp. CCAP 1560/4]|eukprot:KNH04438.1 hypothetical protein XU18_4297 [Perkinsela sp. CCAP 1560/4]